MQVLDYFPDYPSVDSENFVQELTSKFEFYELSEKYPRLSSRYFNIQLYIRRFLSNITPYNKLFLFMEVGTGKTCSAVAAAEGFYINLSKDEGSNLIDYPEPSRKKILIIVKNKILKKQFRSEIVDICERNKYFDLLNESYLEMAEPDRERSVTAQLKKYFEIHTIETFANYIHNSTDDILKLEYSGRQIIFDEAHIVREGEDKETVNYIYSQYERFFNIVNPSNLIFSTGTPVIDNVNETIPLFNLFLSNEDKLPTNIRIDSPEFTSIFREKIRGKIVYVREQLPNVKRYYPDSVLYGTKYTKILPVVMKGLQKDTYIKFIESGDTETFAKVRQNISDGVFPDGSYGNDGYDKYIQETDVSLGGLKIFKFHFKQQYKKLFNEKSLRDLSCKNWKALEIIKSNPKDKFFIYNPSVKSTGLMYFACILNEYGFEQFKGNSLPTTKRPRYIIITHKTNQSSADINRLNKIYNDPKNKYGEYIQLFIGSDIIATGTNLLNTRGVIFLGLLWNYARYLQALGRVLRQNAFDEFIDEERYINIYNLAAVISDKYNPDLVTVNIKQYIDSEKKLILIKPIERIEKEESIACIAFKDRNQKIDILDDFSRECDFQLCEYNCGNGSKLGPIDYTNYNLFFSKDEIEQIHSKIVYIFKTTTSISLKHLFLIFNMHGHNTNLIYIVIDKFLDYQTIVYNRMGEPGYLFLVRDLLVFSPEYVNDDPTIEYYTKHVFINSNISIDNLIFEYEEDTKINNLLKLVEDVNALITSNTKISESIVNKITNLSVQEKASLFESVYGYNTKFSSWLENILKDNIGKLNNIIYHDIYRSKKEETKYRTIKKSLKEDEPIRIYEKNGVWRNATAVEGKKIIDNQNTILESKKEKFQNEDYYGLIKDNQFRIVKNIGDEKSTGRICSTWEKINLIDIIIKYNIPNDIKLDKVYTRQQILNMLNTKKINLDEISKYTDKQLNNFIALYTPNAKRDVLCKLIYDYFSEKKLILSL